MSGPALARAILLGANTPHEIRQAGIWCAEQALQHPDLDPADTARELLYAVGVMPDPHALRRSTTNSSKVIGRQHRPQP